MGDSPSTTDSATWTVTNAHRNTHETVAVATNVQVAARNTSRANRLRVADAETYTVRSTDAKKRVG